MEKLNLLKTTASRILALGIALVLVGAILASAIQTDFGKVEVKDVAFVTADNATIAGTLYIPKDASAENPKPAIVGVHGGNSTRQAQSSFSIEYARRGYVVFAYDQSKNGLSSQKVADSSGSVAAIQYVKGLDFVDKDNIGAEGHSMGGFVLSAIANKGIMGVKSVALNGVSVGFNEGVDPSPAGLKTNVCYVIGEYDENAGPTNWKINGPRYANTAPDVKKVFGIQEDIKFGQWYGNAADNSLRIMHQPKQFHAWMLFSPAVVKLTLDFFNETMSGANDLPTSDQIWMWKEVGSAMAYIGVFMVAFSIISLLLRATWFKSVTTQEVSVQMSSNALHWVCVSLMSVAPIIAVQPLYLKGKALLSKVPYFIVEHVNGVLLWQLVTVIIILGINLIMKKMANGYNWAQDKKLYAVGWTGVTRAIAIAIIVFGVSYALVNSIYFLFNVPVEFIPSELDLFTTLRFQSFLAYLPVYALYYLVLGYVQMSGLDVKGRSTIMLYVITVITNALGIILFAAVFYGSVPIYGISLLHSSRFVGGVLINFIPGLVLSSCIQVYTYKKTNNVITGALINTLLFTWISIASGCLI